MKWLLLILSIWLPGIAWSEIDAASVGEIRATATAGGVNSGWYTPGRGGTDYTLQDSFQSSGTVLASADATAASSCTVTMAGYDFSSTIWPGNSLHATAGANAIITGQNSFHTILSTGGTTGVDSTALTLRGPCGTLNSLSNVTFYIGGSFSGNSTNDADFFQAASSAVATGSYTIYIRGASGVVSAGEGISGLTVGNAAMPIVIEGYNASRGDRPLGTDRPTLAIGANNIFTATDWWIRNLIVTMSGATGVNTAATNKVINAKFLNNSTTAGRVAITVSSSRTTYLDSEIVSERGTAMNISAVAGIAELFGCWIHHSNVGISGAITTGQIVSVDSIYSNLISSSVVLTAAHTTADHFIGNTFYHPLQWGSGISYVTGATHYGSLINNIFSGLTAAVFVTDAQSAIYLANNDFFNNGSNVNANVSLSSSDLTLNPQFARVFSRSGATATTTAGNHLVQSGATFQTWGVAAGDYVCLLSGTGTTNLSCYIIASVDSETQITTTETLTANATGDKVWEITQYADFTPGPNLRNRGFPGTFPGMTNITYPDIGAFQHRDAPKAYAQ